MVIFEREEIKKYTNIKLTLPGIPCDFIEINYLNNSGDVKNDCSFPFAKSGVYESPILSYNVLAKGNDIKTVYEVFIDISNVSETVTILPGDTIGILTQNFKEDVNFLIQHLDLDILEIDKVFELQIKAGMKKGTKLPAYIPKQFTIRKTLLECLDIRAVPKKLFLRSLSTFASDPNDNLILEILSSQEGKQEYDDLFLKKKYNLIDLLKELKSLKPPISILFQHLPRLMPRPYSIASSQLEHQNKIRIIFSTLTDNYGKCLGLTTNLLENKMKTNESIFFYFRLENKFRYTDEIDSNNNIIMIGPGTAIAPFIGFLEHRKNVKQNKHSSTPVAWLFTGCRYSDRNNLYIDTLKLHLKNNILNKVFQSFSRDENNKNSKYVQDVILRHSEEFVSLFLKDETILFVCGDNKNMLPGLKSTIIKCLVNELVISEIDASQIINMKIIKNKYVEDLWS